MSAFQRGRQQWEYAGGSAAGPAAAPAPGAGSMCTEVREVRAADPALSPETNERLTAELRAVIGADRVEVPVDRAHATRGEHPRQHGIAAAFNFHWFHLAVMTVIVLTFAAIISLITNDWWLLPLAAGVHALATISVVLVITRMTTISEHPSPDLAAALAQDGVSNPDEHFSRMVEEFRREPEHGVSEVISPGYNERTVPADLDPAAAAAQQSSAMTPTGGVSRSGGDRGAPDLVIWATAISLLLLSIILPAATGGGWLWLMTAVMVPLIAGWMVFQRLMVTHRNRLHFESRKPLVAIVLCTGVAVGVFCAVVAVGYSH